MKSDIFSISGFYRWNRTDDQGISNACREFANAGTRFLAADAETVKTLPERPGRMRELCRLAADSGLVFRDAHAVWGPGNDLNELTDDSRFAVHEAVIPVLAENGIRTLTFHIGASCIYVSGDWKGKEDHYRSIALHALERLLKSAEKYRITLAVENCFEPSTTAREAMGLVRQFRSEYLGLCLDCGHANLMEPMDGRVVTNMVGYIQRAWKPGIPDFTQGIPEFMSPEIVTVHIHDNDGLDDRHAMPDEHGTIDWKRIASVLADAPRLISLQSEVETVSPDFIPAAAASFRKLEMFLPTQNDGLECRK